MPGYHHSIKVDIHEGAIRQNHPQVKVARAQTSGFERAFLQTTTALNRHFADFLLESLVMKLRAQMMFIKIVRMLGSSEECGENCRKDKKSSQNQEPVIALNNTPWWLSSSLCRVFKKV